MRQKQALTVVPGLVLLVALSVAMATLSGCAQRRLAVERQMRVVTAVDRGNDLLEQGLPDVALSQFEAALEENPTYVPAHIGVGSVYRVKGDYETAKSSYNRATSLDPQSFDAHYYLGLVHQLLGEIQDAVRVYLEALTINPNSYEANHNLAGAYLQLNRPGQSLPYARHAVKIQPDSQAAWSNLAACYSLLKRYALAVDAYRQAVELGELSDPILLGLADAHIRLGNHDRAINVLRTLIRQSPSAIAYERLGYTQFKLRNFDDALASFRAALSIDNDNIASLNGLGVCLMTLYIQGGRTDRPLWEQAIESWRRSTQLNANQPRIVDLISRYQRL